MSDFPAPIWILPRLNDGLDDSWCGIGSCCYTTPLSLTFCSSAGEGVPSGSCGMVGDLGKISARLVLNWKTKPRIGMESRGIMIHDLSFHMPCQHGV